MDKGGLETVGLVNVKSYLAKDGGESIGAGTRGSGTG